MVVPKVGISGDTQTPGVLQTGLKTAERNFVMTENFKSIGTVVKKLLKIKARGGGPGSKK